eukprot:Phypoly_transcript_08380.p1 GENE.Phypoly_transcript_08380~~Phypoly_transcript_08380.p1  ORF type:complete len:464 (+),score=107.75 Phypoly_transcript_08380:49-1392(+)
MESTKTYKRPRYGIGPEDFLDALGMSENKIMHCQKIGIFTIRQFAACGKDVLESLCTISSDLVGEKIEDQRRVVMDMHHRASEILKWDEYLMEPDNNDNNNNNNANNADCTSPPKKQKQNKTVWGYTYVSPSLLSLIDEKHELKSPYTLFQDYVECPIEKKDAHPWRSIYYTFLKEVEECTNSLMVTDADVYSYLIWKGAKSAIGKLDLSAFPRAIPFLFQPMPLNLHKETLQVERIIASQLNSQQGERYAHEIAFDLTRICEELGAKLYLASNVNAQGCVDTSDLSDLEVESVKEKALDWDVFCAGEDIFQKLAHGYIEESEEEREERKEREKEKSDERGEKEERGNRQERGGAGSVQWDTEEREDEREMEDEREIEDKREIEDREREDKREIEDKGETEGTMAERQEKREEEERELINRLFEAAMEDVDKFLAGLDKTYNKKNKK